MNTYRNNSQYLISCQLSQVRTLLSNELTCLTYKYFGWLSLESMLILLINAAIWHKLLLSEVANKFSWIERRLCWIRSEADFVAYFQFQLLRCTNEDLIIPVHDIALSVKWRSNVHPYRGLQRFMCPLAKMHIDEGKNVSAPYLSGFLAHWFLFRSRNCW